MSLWFRGARGYGQRDCAALEDYVVRVGRLEVVMSQEHKRLAGKPTTAGTSRSPPIVTKLRSRVGGTTHMSGTGHGRSRDNWDIATGSALAHVRKGRTARTCLAFLYSVVQSIS
jgi:hypothetical protein